jgi:hypothetical protein
MKDSGKGKTGTRRPYFGGRHYRALGLASTAILAAGVISGASPALAAPPAPGESAALDGSGNNLAHPDWGKLGLPYSRVGPAVYSDGASGMVAGPNTRFVSNRGFNDAGQNLFSENGVTQWGWTWGQFLDHTFGLAASGGAAANIAFNASDPVEEFTNDLGSIAFTRDGAAPGTGVSTPREQINTLNSYIDAEAVYGGSDTRLDWLRDGSLDGNSANNAATLMLPGGYLPTRTARGNPAAAPEMGIDGRLRANPNSAVVAGDVRANENIALTATQTLFAREHNRIVGVLPNTMTAQDKFQLARRVVTAEQQYITYNEFLPAMGVRLPAYTGYNPNVNATLSNEFATVGYRAHSQIHGEFELETDRDRYSPAQLNAFAAAGIKVEDGETPDEVVLAVPLNVAFFNPTLLPQLGEGPMLQSLSGEPQYQNDEMIDNHLRSVLFQVPRPGNTACIEPVDPACFNGVTDLGAIDIERGRDHGIPSYNALRQAYGLAPRTSFSAIAGGSEAFPSSPVLTPGNEVNDPDSVKFTQLFDKNGAPIALDSPAAAADPIRATRVSTTAARLRATYGTVNRVDAFMGMVAEPHVAGTEFGQLQLAIWTRQFQALRDGDRFFYGNDTARLNQIAQQFGVDYRRTLAQVITANTDIPAAELPANVFRVPAGTPLAPGRILGIDSQRCLDVPGASQTNGVQVQVFACNETDAQGWSQQANRTIQVFANKCLDVRGQGTANATPVQIWDCTGTANQQWTFNADGSIVGAGSGRCLDVRRETGNGDGAQLQIWDCTGNPWQRFIR